MNFDRARSATQREITTWSFESNLQYFKTGKTSLRTSCLYIRYGKLDTKWRSRKTKSRKEKSSTTVDGEFDT